MTNDQPPSMSDGRALLTEREREALAGEASDNYRYKTRTYFRHRLKALEDDVKLLAREEPELLKELREVVCADTKAGGERNEREAGLPEDAELNRILQGFEFEGESDAGADLRDGPHTDMAPGVGSVVDELDIQGTGPDERGRRAALTAILKYLEEHEEAATRELKEIVEEYPHGFGGGVDSFWANTWRRDALPQLEEHGLVESGGSAGKYYWAG